MNQSNLSAQSFKDFIQSYLQKQRQSPPLILLVKLMVLILITIFTINRIKAQPWAIFIVLFWMGTLIYSQVRDITHKPSRISSWLKKNLFSSFFNACLTLIIVLILASAVSGIIDYAIVRATFSPNMTAPQVRPKNVGASWGVIPGSAKLLLTGTLEMRFLPRIWAAFWILTGLIILSFLVFKARAKTSLKWAKKILLVLWLCMPVILIVLLVGVGKRASLINIRTVIEGTLTATIVFLILSWQKVINFDLKGLLISLLIWPVVYIIWGLVGQTGWFPPINVEHWGGLLLTLIITVFASIFSFPVGVALAFGRRSKIRGIPAWFTWSAATLIAGWGFINSSPELLSSARNGFEKATAFWPVLILVIAWLFQKIFKGNVIAIISTFFIEVTRGVPLITILFMAIVMAPLFFREGVQLKNTWSVLIGYTLFNSAYLAEILRGGLNAIPTGQIEAADSLGLNGLQKIWFVILPQAIQLVIPALVNLFVGLFKASSVVGIVGLFDLMGIVSSVTGNPNWQGLRTELYVFAALIYFIGSYAMSSYSQNLERKLSSKKRLRWKTL